MMQVRYDNHTINVYGIMYEWFHYHNEYLIAKNEEGRKYMYDMEKIFSEIMILEKIMTRKTIS